MTRFSQPVSQDLHALNQPSRPDWTRYVSCFAFVDISFLSDLTAISTSLKVNSSYETVSGHSIDIWIQYYWVALSTILFYDYFLTLQDEVRFISL